MKVSRITLKPKHLIFSLIAMVAASQASFARTEFNSTFNNTLDSCNLSGTAHHENNHFDCGSGRADLHANYTENLEFSNIIFSGTKLLFTLVSKGTCHDIDCRSSLFGGMIVNKMDITGTGVVTSTLPMQVSMPETFRATIKKTSDATFVTKLSQQTIDTLKAQIQSKIVSALKDAIDGFQGSIPGLTFGNLHGGNRAQVEVWLKHNVWQAKIVERAMVKVSEILAAEISSTSERALDFLTVDEWKNASFELDDSEAGANNRFITILRD